MTRDLGAELTEGDYERACYEKAVFKEFLEEHVFPQGTVLLLPCGDNGVSFRDDYSGFVTRVNLETKDA
jgi:hypothetical protein